MTNLSDDVALKIALAARALADVEVGDLLEGILMLVGEPLTLAKLKKIRLGKLKQLECLADVSANGNWQLGFGVKRVEIIARPVG